MRMYSNRNFFNQINLTPLTDIFLVLLVVMILVSPNMQRYVLKIDPPSYGCPVSDVPPDQNLLRVKLDAKGNLRIADKEMIGWSSISLQRSLEERQKQLGTKDFPIRISLELDTKQKALVEVLDAAVGAGIKRVQIEEPGERNQ